MQPILFPTQVASLLWIGLYLRDPALRAFRSSLQGELMPCAEI